MVLNRLAVIRSKNNDSIMKKFLYLNEDPKRIESEYLHNMNF